MSPKSRLNITLSQPDLDLLRSVVPPRQLSGFIRSAALEKAGQLKRAALRRQIVEAYEADPEFLSTAGAEWDVVAEEDWPQP